MSNIDLDSILSTARSQFKNKDKGLGQQIMRGSHIYAPENSVKDYIYWPASPWSLMTGVPGIPFGKIVQIAGKPDSGKSTHAMQFMRLAQEQDRTVIVWDTENKFSARRFDKHFGGCSEELLLVSSQIILDGADLAKSLIGSILEKYKDHKILFVWDSVGGSISRGEGDKSFRETNQMAEAAKDNGKVMRGIVSLTEKYRDEKTGAYRLGTCLINQTYSNIGAPGQKEAGGQKVEFHSSLILQLARKGDLAKVRNKVKRRIGITTRARVKKNHLFDGDDTIAEMDLDITAGGISINAKDPSASLVEELVLNKGEEFVVDEDQNPYEEDD